MATGRLGDLCRVGAVVSSFQPRVQRVSKSSCTVFSASRNGLAYLIIRAPCIVRLHVVLVLQPHQRAQGLLGDRLRGRNVRVSQRRLRADPDSSAVKSAPVEGALDDCVRNLNPIINRLPHHQRRTMRNSLCRNSSHCCTHVIHLEEVLSVAVRPDGSIATDNAPDVLHVDVATLPLRQVARWTHLKPEVEAEAVNVLCDSVQDSWLEMRLAVSEKHTGEWRLFALRGLEVCGESLSEEV